MNRFVLACGGIVLTLAASGCCGSRCCGYAGSGVPQGAYAAPVGMQSAMVTMPSTAAVYPTTTYGAPTTTAALAPLESLPTY